MKYNVLLLSLLSEVSHIIICNLLNIQLVKMNARWCRIMMF